MYDLCWSWRADGPPAVWYKDNRPQQAFSALSHTVCSHLHMSDSYITVRSVFNMLFCHYTCTEKKSRCMTIKVKQMWLQCSLACASLSLQNCTLCNFVTAMKEPFLLITRSQNISTSHHSNTQNGIKLVTMVAPFLMGTYSSLLFRYYTFEVIICTFKIPVCTL